MFRKSHISSSLSIFLLMVMLFNFGGYLIFFFVQLHLVKKEAIAMIQQGMEVEELVRLSVDRTTAGDLDWIEKNEFRYEGQLYDIVYTERSSTATAYYCYPDTNETALIAALNRVTRHLKNNRKNNRIKIIKVFRDDPEISITLLKRFFKSQDKIANSYLINYKSLPSTVSIPPPKSS